MKRAVGVLIGAVGYMLKTDCAVGYEAARRLRERGLEAVELSGDVFTMIDELKKRPHDVLILLGARQAGRPPGSVEVYEFKPYRYRDEMEAADALRPSLEGRISLEDLLIGLSVLGPTAGKIYVVECEPPNPEPGVGLSPEGERCAEELARRVEELYTQLTSSPT